MYTWIWRHLPGSAGSKVAQSLLLVLAAAALLLFVVFPAVEPHLPFNDVTIDRCPSESAKCASARR